MVNEIHLLPWNVDPFEAECHTRALYPGAEVRVLPPRQFREAGWKGQLRILRSLRGQAVVFCFAALSEVPELRLLALSAFVHRCRHTVITDFTGTNLSYTRRMDLRLLPVSIAYGLSDVITIFFTAIYLMFSRRRCRPIPLDTANSLEQIAYLFPYTHLLRSGGAATHISGFLSGMKQNGAWCDVFSGTAMQTPFPVTQIDARSGRHLLREAISLAFNWRFARLVRKALTGRRGIVLYQRHGRYTFAGAIISKWIRAPLVVEYNGSEIWVARHWDPARMPRLLALCEEVSIRSANLLVVVSAPLRDELVERGIPSERILVNPNAVDPAEFECGDRRDQVRRNLGIKSGDVLVSFVGSFSYWHGVGVLADAIALILDREKPSSAAGTKFLLIGTGPLHDETKKKLERYIAAESVIMPGAVAHSRVPELLVASDIGVSPHVPMPDGTRFFGSPTKLFEYMASGKAIIASALDQLAEILEHQHTAWLVRPGDPRELADAIASLANDPALRETLGHNARTAALKRHTWSLNAARVASAANVALVKDKEAATLLPSVEVSAISR